MTLPGDFSSREPRSSREQVQIEQVIDFFIFRRIRFLKGGFYCSFDSETATESHLRVEVGTLTFRKWGFPGGVEPRHQVKPRIGEQKGGTRNNLAAW